MIQTINEKEISTISTLEIAKMMGVKHYKILEKLEGTKDGKTKGIIPILTKGQMALSDYFIQSSYKDTKGEIRKCYECTRDGVKAILDSTRNYKNKVALYDWYYTESKIECSPIIIEREELSFFNALNDVLKVLKVRGISQFKVLKYYIDYYIPSLGLAIEYDEGNHVGYSYEEHEGRQAEIERELGCKFIRLDNRNNMGINLGITIKYIILCITKEEWLYDTNN